MRQRKNKRKYFLVLLLILVLLISIGYSTIYTTLIVDGRNTIKSQNWSVYFTNIQTTLGSIIPETAPTTSETSTTSLTWVLNMDEPGQFYEFTVDVVNDGSLDAMIGEIEDSTLSEEQARYLNYSVTYFDDSEIEQYDVLVAGEVVTLKVRVDYRTDIDPEDLPENSDQISLSYNLNYVQANYNTNSEAINLNEAILTNDKNYIAEIESDEYVGEAQLKIYTLDGTNYIGKISLGQGEVHSWTISEIMQNEIFDENFEEVEVIEYHGTNENRNFIKSENVNISIENYSKKEDDYSILGKAYLKVLQGQQISQEEIKEFVSYAINCNNLEEAYDFINNNIEPETLHSMLNDAEKTIFDANVENQVLQYILTQDLSSLVDGINDQIFAIKEYLLSVDSSKTQSLSELANVSPYSLIDIAEEDDGIREFYTLVIGNGIIPFTCIYLQTVSEELVQNAQDFDENTSFSLNCAKIEYDYNCGNLAGFLPRCFANIYVASMNNTNLSEDEMESIYQYAVSAHELFWILIYQIYGNEKLYLNHEYDIPSLGITYSEEIRNIIFDQYSSVLGL